MLLSLLPLPLLPLLPLLLRSLCCRAAAVTAAGRIWCCHRCLCRCAAATTAACQRHCCRRRRNCYVWPLPLPLLLGCLPHCRCRCCCLLRSRCHTVAAATAAAHRTFPAGTAQPAQPLGHCSRPAAATAVRLKNLRIMRWLFFLFAAPFAAEKGLRIKPLLPGQKLLHGKEYPSIDCCSPHPLPLPWPE